MNKFVITESQLKKILSEVTYKDKKIYEDENVVVSTTSPDKGNREISYGDKEIFLVLVENKTSEWMTLRVEKGKDWGARGEKNLDYPKKPLSPKGGSGYIGFRVDNLKSQSGFFTTNLILTYITNKIQKTVNLAFPFQQLDRKNIIQYCKSIYSNDVLNKAKKFVKDWLDNSQTFSKFSKNWQESLDVDDAISIFKDYKSAIDNVRLEYETLPNSNNLASVTPLNFNKWFHTSYGVPIVVNCRKEFLDTTKRDKNLVSVLSHELQHILDMIHPWQPSSKTPTSKSGGKGSGQQSSSSTENLGSSKKSAMIVNRLKQDGFDSKQIDEIAKDYQIYVSRRDFDYIKSENELASFLFGYRKKWNLKPSDIITPQFFIKNKSDDRTWLVRFYLTSGLPLKQFLDSLNSYAKNKSSQSYVA